jgi:hypothetical protein
LCCGILHLRGFDDQTILVALQALHKIGYVHRDVSEGNILGVKRSSGSLVGVLADLEYVKEIAELKPHDVRTGTRMFMALEVLCGRWMFSGRNRSHVPFKHNALHGVFFFSCARLDQSPRSRRFGEPFLGLLLDRHMLARTRKVISERQQVYV